MEVIVPLYQQEQLEQMGTLFGLRLQAQLSPGVQGVPAKDNNVRSR
jgi:hypothetical protein